MNTEFEMDIGKAFSFVFEDKEWPVKVLIGGLLLIFSFLVIPLFIVLGYFAQVIKNAAEAKEPLLPVWDDYENKLVKGFLIMVIYIIYELPIIALLIVYSIIATALSAATSSQGGQTAIGIFLLVLFLIVALAIFLYSIFLLFALPVATIKYAVSENFGQAFKFGEIWTIITRNTGSLLVVILLSFVAGIIGSLGVIAFFVGAAFTSFYAVAVIGNLYGQFSRQASGKLTIQAAEIA
jgi:hypothetical protein